MGLPVGKMARDSVCEEGLRAIPGPSSSSVVGYVQHPGPATLRVLLNVAQLVLGRSRKPIVWSPHEEEMCP